MRLLVIAAATVAAAVPALIAVRLAKVTFAELRGLHITVLEMKRRMSVARVASSDPHECPDARPRVSFDGGGDPEHYGSSKDAFIGRGASWWTFLTEGRLYSTRPAYEREPSDDFPLHA